MRSGTCSLYDKSVVRRADGSTAVGGAGRVCSQLGEGDSRGDPGSPCFFAMTLLIDTGAVPAPDRVEFWASSSCDVYHPLHIRTDRDAPERFQARMWGDWLASVGLFRVAASANTMSRTWEDIAAGDPECLHLSILLRGHLQGEQQHRTSVLAPGDMTTYDTSEPAVFRAPGPFDLLVLKLPKATLGKHAEKVSRLTGLRIPGQSGLPRLAVRFFCGAAAGLADGSIAGEDTGLAEHVIDL